MSTNYTCRVASPLGTLTLQSNGQALTHIWLPNEEGHHTDGEAVDGPILAAARQQLQQYFAGTRTAFDLPLEPQGTAFQQEVWSELCRIEYGAVVTYAELAQRVHRPRAWRAVGAANGRNPLPVVVPCHRVIGTDGRLTGFAGGLPAKAWLLEHENRS